MPWNEPGKSSNNKDPWTGKQTPPDLEAFLRNLRKKIAAFFKLKSKIIEKNNPSLKKTVLPIQFNRMTYACIFGAMLLVWAWSGLFTVAPAEQALITRFGKYHATLAQGVHWIFRPIETEYIFAEKNTTFFYPVQLVTRDKNPIYLNVQAQYTVTNPQQYLFANTQSLQSLKDAIAHTLQQNVSPLSLTQLLATDMTALQRTLQGKANTLLSLYATGLTITRLHIQVPEELKSPFEAVKQAYTDKLQLENDAKTYAQQRQLEAQAEAKNIIAKANNYQRTVILKAKTEVTGFLALLPAYALAPQLTQQRLYLEAMQTIMAHSHKILLNIPDKTTLSLNLDSLLKAPLMTEPEAKTAIQTANTTQAKTMPSVTITPKNKLLIPADSEYNITGGYE